MNKDSDLFKFILKHIYLIIIAVVVGFGLSWLYLRFSESNNANRVYSKNFVVSYVDSEACFDDCPSRMINSFKDYLFLDSNIDRFKKDLNKSKNEALINEDSSVVVPQNSNLILISLSTKTKTDLEKLPSMIVKEINSDFKSNYPNLNSETFKIINDSKIQETSKNKSPNKITSFFVLASLAASLVIIFVSYDLKNYKMNAK